MHILYGVVGEGMGHAMRSRVILEHLVAQGHEVTVMASGRAVEYLSKRLKDVRRIHGLHMLYEENRVRPMATLWSNVRKGIAGVPTNVAAYYRMLGDHLPQAVISDFESWTYWFGIMHGLPVLSVDNMQAISRCRLPHQVTDGHRAQYLAARAFVGSKLPRCDRYFVTTFFNPPVQKRRTELFPPILRPEILGASRREGGHLLAYTTGEGNAAFAEALRQTGIECRVYGLRRGITADETEGNLRFRPFGENAFIDDLASCRAVVAGGGFTLMGEAVYLGKPMLAVPMGGQFEQALNANYLQLVGYGQAADRLDRPQTVRGFLDRIPEYAANLAQYGQDGNARIFAAIDSWLARAR